MKMAINPEKGIKRNEMKWNAKLWYLAYDQHAYFIRSILYYNMNK